MEFFEEAIIESLMNWRPNCVNQPYDTLRNFLGSVFLISCFLHLWKLFENTKAHKSSRENFENWPKTQNISGIIHILRNALGG
jgi:hypothetical protein